MVVATVYFHDFIKRMPLVVEVILLTLYCPYYPPKGWQRRSWGATVYSSLEVLFVGRTSLAFSTIFLKSFRQHQCLYGVV